MNESQNFDQFITDEGLQLAGFVMWWRQQHTIIPQAFPLRLEPGLWDESLQTFDPKQPETFEHGNIADGISCGTLSRDPAGTSRRPGCTAQLVAESLSALRQMPENVEHPLNPLRSDPSESK